MLKKRFLSRVVIAGVISLMVGNGSGQSGLHIGAWCFLQPIPAPQPIYTPSPGVWRVYTHERDKLLNLGLNYFIACTGLNAEQAMIFMGDSLASAPSPKDFKTTVEFSPANGAVGAPYQVWASILQPGGPGNPTWEARVDCGWFHMNRLYGGHAGLHSFLAGAETNLNNPTFYPWAQHIAGRVHVHAPGVQATFETDHPVNLD